MKTILTAVALATLVAAPAFAGSFTAGADGMTAANAVQIHKAVGGRNSFAMAPRGLSLYSPTLNGGGSIGYNQQLHTLDAAY